MGAENKHAEDRLRAAASGKSGKTLVQRNDLASVLDVLDETRRALVHCATWTERERDLHAD
jgi:hypothetical protein